ncbi:MAG: Na+/H+ antiporter NhaC family protein [Myxococcota bacterium]
MTPVPEPSWTSLVPAIVAIALAFATRQVIVALFAGIVAGGGILFAGTHDVADLNLIERFLFPALGTQGFAQILLIYLWCLGGLIGIWTRTGAALHFARTVGSRVARGPNSALFFSWLLGIVFHQGGTVSTVLTATTVRPVADRHRISHEELAYVVDSTASPVATLIPFNAWPAYVGGLAAGTVGLIPDAEAGVRWFFAAIPFNFYAIFAVLSTALFALGRLPWVGPSMARARQRARETGRLDADDAEPMLLPPQDPPADPTDYTPSLLDFGIPLGTLLGVAVIPYGLARAGLIANGNWINEAFLLAVLSAMVVARLRGMRLREVLEAFVSGCRGMTIGALILALAVTLGGVSRELHTADFLTGAIGGSLPHVLLPAILTLVCMGIAFATGSSWGTYAVVVPVALPLAWALHPDAFFLEVCLGAVLGGAVYGDQCSPISDTTILSSMFCGCDLMHHVRTQLPLATVAALAGAVASTAILLAD